MAGPNLSMPSAISQMFDFVRDQSGMVMSLTLRPDWASLFQSMQQLTFASTRYGPTAERPTSTMASRYIGMPYFDTDLGAKGEPVWRNKDNTGWVTLSGSSSGSGTVTSVNVSTAADLTVSTSGGPVTSTGTILITALDAGSNKLVGWDDAASTKRYFDLGTGISITSTTINVSTGTGSLTSVAVSTVADATVSTSGSPITSSGTILLTALDAGADKLVGWDDSASTKIYYDLGTNISITSTTINVSGGAVFTEFRFTADPDTGFDNATTNTIEATTGGTTRMRFSASSSALVGSPTASGSNGKDMTFQGGTGGSSQGLISGKSILLGGVSTGNTGGAAEVRGGDGTTGGGGSTQGGVVTIKAGAAAGNQNGVDVTISGGDPGPTGTVTGGVNITGGTPTSTNGGNVNIFGSAGVGANKNGGNVTIYGGAATGTGVPGVINVSSNVQLLESVSILIDEALSSDGKYTAIKSVNGVAGEGSAYGAIMYLKTDAKWYKALADTTTTAGPVAIGANLVSSAANASTTIMLDGDLRADALYGNLPIGTAIFLSDTTAGSITTTAPTTTAHVTRVLGHVDVTGKGMLFRPSPDWLTHT